MARELNSDQSLGELPANIGELFIRNEAQFPEARAFSQKVDDEFFYWNWKQVALDIYRFSNHLFEMDLSFGDHVAIVSTNSYKRFIAEMAIMNSGMVAVPIFPEYPIELLSKLIDFSDVKLLIIEKKEKLKALPKKILPERILKFDDIDSILSDTKLLDVSIIQNRFNEVKADSLALIMFTSGTTNFPKGVMLTHKNILSQQKSIELLWKLPKGLRFLCYLPWHHSFGGLFERFLAVNNAGMLAIDDSSGKDTDLLIENFKTIKPHIYFSVPRVYQEIIGKVLSSSEIAQTFFHDDLNFVFTAAAPLPLSTSKVFKDHDIPVVEGWGLTETSPCCTLTTAGIERSMGVVGFPIADVQIKLADEEEIWVKGPNVMKGYYKQPEETARVMDQDGWFKTGDVGEITEAGVKIVCRKDRIFKLSNAEKVFPVTLEENIRKRCNFVKYIYVFGSGQPHPLALVFPNLEMVGEDSPEMKISNCETPKSLDCMSKCFSGCLKELNENHSVRYEKIRKALIINRELSIENQELTPSMKLVPRFIEKNYKDYIDCLVNQTPELLPSDSFIVDL